MRPTVETRRSNGSNLREAVEFIVMGHTRKCLNSGACVFDPPPPILRITSLKQADFESLQVRPAESIQKSNIAHISGRAFCISGHSAVRSGGDLTAASTGIPLGLTRDLRHNRVLHEHVLLIASINTAA
jgi:hypothetical protein